MNRIRELRVERNLTMRDAAEQIGIPYTTYVNYEKGLREPNSEMLIVLADFYNVTIDYMLCRVDSRLRKRETVKCDLADDEQHLIEIYRSLTPAHKETILSTASDFAALDAQKNKDLSLVEKAN